MNVMTFAGHSHFVSIWAKHLHVCDGKAAKDNMQVNEGPDLDTAIVCCHHIYGVADMGALSLRKSSPRVPPMCVEEPETCPVLSVALGWMNVRGCGSHR